MRGPKSLAGFHPPWVSGANREMRIPTVAPIRSRRELTHEAGVALVGEDEYGQREDGCPEPLYEQCTQG